MGALSSLHEDSAEETRRFMASCVAAIRQHAGGAAGGAAGAAGSVPPSGSAGLSVPPAGTSGSDAGAPAGISGAPAKTPACIVGAPPDARALLFLFDRLNELVCPERPEIDYALQLTKAATQEVWAFTLTLQQPIS